MKRLLIPLAIAVSLGCASAAPLYFDPFADATANGGTSYTVGTSLINQKNNSANIWNGVNTTAGGPQPMVVAGNLSYPNLPPSSGNAASFVPTNNGQSVRLNFNATITTNQAYYSYKLKVTDISLVPSTNANNPFAGWSDGNTAQPGAPVARVGSKILTKTSGGGFLLGIGRNNTVGDYQYDPTVHNVGDTIFVVASYELVGGVTNVNLWVNPPTNSFGSNTPPAVTVTAHASNLTGDLNTSRVQGFVILCQSSNAPSGIIDDVRIGTNWSDVTGGDPAITTQPANQNVQAGHNATFTVVARGTPTLTYQWSKDGNPLSDGGNITGSSSTALTVSGVSTPDLGGYSVIVSNGVGNSVQSTTATLAFQTDPTIITQPQDTTTNFGGSVTLTVTPNGTSPFTYQWHKIGSGDLSDGGNITGSTTSALTLNPVSGADTAAYSVTVSNVNGSVDSSNANVTIIDPYFTLNPVSATNNAGTTATFTVAATGTGISFYQWYKNAGTVLEDIGNISGSGTQTLTVSNVSASDAITYFATVTGTFGTTTSTVVTLTVLTPVGITAQPSPRTVAPGVRTVFAVGTSGSGPISYQWQLNGANVSNGNAFFYTVSNAQTALAGMYQVIVSNSFSSATSSPVALTVSNVALSQSNLMIIRAGDGGQTLNLTGNSMYVDQYQTDGTYVSTVTIPDSGPNAMVTLGMDNQTGVNSGATTGSCITRSLDGRFMVIAGYNTNLTYTTNLSLTPAAAVPHGIGLIDSRGFYTLPVVDTHSNFDSTTWRAGITDGTNNFFGGASTVGTFYFGFDAAAGLVQNTMVNMRSMSLYNGDIYCAGAQAGAVGVLKIPGMPNGSGAASLILAGSSGTFDMTVSPNGNLIYVADQRALGANGTNGGIQRWDFNGSTWGLTYTLQIGGTSSAHNGPRYLVGDFSGASPVLYATANDGTLDNNHLIVVTDTGSGSTATALATAGVNQTFRGIQFGPLVNTIVSNASISISSNGAGAQILTWTAPFSLQSSTNVTGVYTNVPGASSPYTNTFTDPQRFFRLRQLE